MFSLYVNDCIPKRKIYYIMQLSAKKSVYLLELLEVFSSDDGRIDVLKVMNLGVPYCLVALGWIFML